MTNVAASVNSEASGSTKMIAQEQNTSASGSHHNTPNIVPSTTVSYIQKGTSVTSKKLVFGSRPPTTPQVPTEAAASGIYG